MKIFNKDTRIECEVTENPDGSVNVSAQYIHEEDGIVATSYTADWVDPASFKRECDFHIANKLAYADLMPYQGFRGASIDKFKAASEALGMFLEARNA